MACLWILRIVTIAIMCENSGTKQSESLRCLAPFSRLCTVSERRLLEQCFSQWVSLSCMRAAELEQLLKLQLNSHVVGGCFRRKTVGRLQQTVLAEFCRHATLTEWVLRRLNALLCRAGLDYGIDVRRKAFTSSRFSANLHFICFNCTWLLV